MGVSRLVELAPTSTRNRIRSAFSEDPNSGQEILTMEPRAVHYNIGGNGGRVGSEDRYARAG